LGGENCIPVLTVLAMVPEPVSKDEPALRREYMHWRTTNESTHESINQWSNSWTHETIN